MKEVSIAAKAGRSTGLLAGAGRERSVILRGRITRQLAACCIARLIVLGTEHTAQPIIVYIDSPGGSIVDSMPILSTLGGLKSPIATFCTGEVGGPAIAIAAAGLRGCRAALAGARFHFNPLRPARAGRSVASDDKFLQMLAEMLAANTGKPQAEVFGWLQAGAQFGADQALVNGLIDCISPKPVLPKPVTKS